MLRSPPTRKPPVQLFYEFVNRTELVGEARESNRSSAPLPTATCLDSLRLSVSPRLLKSPNLWEFAATSLRNPQSSIAVVSELIAGELEHLGSIKQYRSAPA
jgi:hypothetical protein